jgi:hypothetical protein
VARSRQNHLVLIAVALAAVCGLPLLASAAGKAAEAGATRISALEDREAIRLVLRDYGKTLDERRFEDFGRLFAADGEYVSGGQTTRGPEAIAAALRQIFSGNSFGLGEPSFHVLFNERIELQGDRATATSQAFFVAPGADGAPRLIMMASYDDRFVRTPDGWRFARRVVSGSMLPRASTN